MENHFELSDNSFAAAFQNCSLPPEIFTHEAHLRIAWLYLKQFGVEPAVELVCRHLKNYVQHLGASDKYNETLTVAAVRAVNHFMLQSDISDFETFIAQHPRLKYHFRDLIAQHYRSDIFNSAAAKKRYLEPDLLPF